MRLEYRDEGDRQPVKQEYHFKAQKDEAWLEKLVGDPIALFTLVLTAATIGLYGATRRLWEATERLVKGADETSQRQLRAYIFPETVTISISRAGHVQFFASFKNSGQTPAFDVVTSGGCFIGRYPLSEPGPHGDPQGDVQSNGSIGPGGPFHLITNLEGLLSNLDRAKIISGTAALYFFGSIDYVDTFNIPRFTKYCYMRTASDASGPMNVYRHYNDAN